MFLCDTRLQNIPAGTYVLSLPGCHQDAADDALVNPAPSHLLGCVLTNREKEHWPRDEFERRELPITGGYGRETIIRPRLGQKSFRVVVLDAYSRRCAVTNERTLPALEAAHIRDYHDVQEHAITNSISFRADIHKLFDRGYVTVTPDHHFEVSKRIKEEFENGRDYYALHGATIRLPERLIDRPDAEALRWHNENRYLG